MTAIKESSTIQENKLYNRSECPVIYVMDKIGGYWKPVILFHLLKGGKRYNELRKLIPTITEKMLIQNLKQLEADGIVRREAKAVVPPYVTYYLTTAGEGLRPVLYAMASWALEDQQNTKGAPAKQLKDFPA
ncbi:winged helix-turn-helix transcriptional regulator [Deminuibacter soli]|uniref:Transcriptional regulator n=1 Tax=Deminuibacter soli TaxID=2291815 RepID=A0A3E1ND71_9BACT|nr:helix-turn-helix domain-containing protein [Deminuibacter soli]RFM25784.1 transcriptional regulator [Deminuibacter soli]